VKAARELLLHGELRRINRASAATEPAVDAIRKIVHEAARTKTRHLILVTGVPGAGKTLVGLQTVHAHYLDDLAIDRGNGKPTAPAVFLSGNGPLVQVLQYELKSAGGDGKTFVRDVKNYVKTYSSNRKKIPHRIRKTSDTRFTKKAERNRRFQVDELLDAAKVTVFVITPG
jgi:hypothetical protein